MQNVTGPKIKTAGEIASSSKHLQGRREKLVVRHTENKVPISPHVKHEPA